MEEETKKEKDVRIVINDHYDMEGQTTNTAGLQKILSSRLGFEFKYNRLLAYFHKGLFPFADSHIGEGNERRFDLEDVISMVAAVEIYLDTKNLELAKFYSGRIRSEIRDVLILKAGVLIVSKELDHGAVTKNKDLKVHEVLSWGEKSGIVNLYPLFKTAEEVKKLWTGL